MKLFQVFYIGVFVSKIWRSSSCKLLSLLKNEMINDKSEKHRMHVNDMQLMIEYIECLYRLKDSVPQWLVEEVIDHILL